jgi:hypothetical protein
MEPALESFRALAKELVTVHGVKQSRLLDEIRNTLLDCAQSLPQYDVLFCNSYGGFRCSDAFYEFVATAASASEAQDGHAGRARLAKHIAPFGRVCMERHPAVGRMLHLYHAHDLGWAFSKVASISCDAKQCERYARHVAAIRAAPDEAFGGAAPDEACDEGAAPDEACDEGDGYVLTVDDYMWKATLEDGHLKIAPRQAWLECAVACLDKHMANEASERSELVTRYDAGVVHLMLASHSHKFAEEVENEARPHYERYDWKKPSEGQGKCWLGMDFTEALAYYGDDSMWKAWKCQQHYDECAMRFLALHRDALPAIPAIPGSDGGSSGSDDDEEVALHAGLLFASTGGCKLALRKVPQHVCWGIKQYDGLETVHLL